MNFGTPEGAAFLLGLLALAATLITMGVSWTLRDDRTLPPEGEGADEVPSDRYVMGLIRVLRRLRDRDRADDGTGPP